MRYFEIPDDNGLKGPRVNDTRDINVIGIRDNFTLEDGIATVVIEGWMYEADYNGGVPPAVIRMVVVPGATRADGIDALIDKLIAADSLTTHEGEVFTMQGATEI